MSAITWVFSLALLSRAHAADRFALVTSAADGGPDRARLQHTTADAERIASVLLTVGGVGDSALARLTDPTVDEVRRALARLGEQVARSPRGEVVVYFTGHADQDGLQFGTSELPYLELRATIDAMEASVRVVVIDGCSSGAILREKGGVHEAPLTTGPSLDGVAYLTSSAADEVSQESDVLGGSFFTHSLATGLRGAADRSADGQVTLAEAYQYAYAGTLSLTERTLGGAQHASFDLRLAGAGDVVLTRLDAVRGQLVLPPSLGETVTVRSEGGSVVAELEGERTTDALLAVVPGRYDVLVRDADGLRGVTVSVGDGPTVVERDELTARDEPQVRQKGGHNPVKAVLLGLAAVGYTGAAASWTGYSLKDPLQRGDTPLHAFYFFGALGVMSTTTLVVLPGGAR